MGMKVFGKEVRGPEVEDKVVMQNVGIIGISFVWRVRFRLEVVILLLPCPRQSRPGPKKVCECSPALLLAARFQ